MASLALLVSLIFIFVILSGPLSLLFNYLNMFWMSCIFGLLSIVFGIHWFCATPFPISIIGTLSAICGAYAIYSQKGMKI
jgi:hypothetical protein